MDFAIDHDPIAAGHLIAVSGELDLAAVPRLSTVLAIAGTGHGGTVVLDLAAVDFIDSSALGTIIRAASDLEKRQTVLAVVAPEGAVRRLLEVTNLSGRFALFATREDALAAAAGA